MNGRWKFCVESGRESLSEIIFLNEIPATVAQLQAALMKNLKLVAPPAADSDTELVLLIQDQDFNEYVALTTLEQLDGTKKHKLKFSTRKRSTRAVVLPPQPEPPSQRLMEAIHDIEMLEGKREEDVVLPTYRSFHGREAPPAAKTKDEGVLPPPGLPKWVQGPNHSTVTPLDPRKRPRDDGASEDDEFVDVEHRELVAYVGNDGILRRGYLVGSQTTNGVEDLIVVPEAKKDTTNKQDGLVANGEIYFIDPAPLKWSVLSLKQGDRVVFNVDGDVVALGYFERKASSGFIMVRVGHAQQARPLAASSGDNELSMIDCVKIEDVRLVVAAKEGKKPLKMAERARGIAARMGIGPDMEANQVMERTLTLKPGAHGGVGSPSQTISAKEFSEKFSK